ncbi:hypothetical protein SM19410_06390 [Xanthomonas hortorum pv. gardneri]|nr:hypothetical protein BJD10_18875 [Xanthomonas hortorum pv. gardneri]ASW48273.1 hypothetical protein XJ27_21795 [Xanthomonas hortorum]PPU49116.1 hypothetical protein XcyCFBP4188_01675 [Xanthomonas hortorum pv. cynarae]APP85665.1 hypothetical protein BI317_17325 [Xanthomonas hortorum pv. gardneri]KLA99608.1 hypothetical protein SM19410_06390 [Xanthomonas hortorum pv. gardneri]
MTAAPARQQRSMRACDALQDRQHASAGRYDDAASNHLPVQVLRGNAVAIKVSRASPMACVADCGQ